MTPRQINNHLFKIQRSHQVAVNAYREYSQRPGTATGNKAYDRYLRYSQEVDDNVEALRKRLVNDDA